MTEAANQPITPHTDQLEMENASAAADEDKDGRSESRENDAGNTPTASARTTISLPLDKARKRKRKKNAVALFSDDEEDDEKKHRVGLLELNLDERQAAEDRQAAGKVAESIDGAARVSSGDQGPDFVGDDSGEPQQLVAAGSEGGGVAATHDSEGSVAVDGRFSRETDQPGHLLSNGGQGHQEQDEERQATMETLQSRPHNQEGPPTDDQDASDFQSSQPLCSHMTQSPQPLPQSEETGAVHGTGSHHSTHADDSIMMLDTDNAEHYTGVANINMDQDHDTKSLTVSAFNGHDEAISNQQIRGEPTLDANINQDPRGASELPTHKSQENTDHPTVDPCSTQGMAGAQESQTFSNSHDGENEEITAHSLVGGTITQDIGDQDESRTSSTGHAAESAEITAHSTVNANITPDAGGADQSQSSSNSNFRASSEITVHSTVANDNSTQDIGGTDRPQETTTCSVMQTKPEKAASPHATVSPPVNQQQQQQAVQQKVQQLHQPPGWRVKLYRLNKDGTWDDCGTGRIQFYFAKANQSQMTQHQNQSLQQQQQQQQLHSNHHATTTGQKKATNDSKPLTAHASSEHAPPPKHPPQNFQSLHQAVFRELGEPMLCMRAEIPPQHESPSQQSHGEETSNNSVGNKVLLRTRVLLNNAYQCQGGNIITWCEPFHVQGGGQQHQQQQQQQQYSRQQHSAGRGPPPSQQMGVDLALSFQDNAGFKDIWQHILDVQLRAKELSHFWTRAGHANVHSSSATGAASKNLSADVIASTTQANNIGQTGHFNDAQTPFQHHNHQPLSPEKSHHLHLHQPLSPNSPDHDALEDRQLSMVTLPKHPPLWSGHHAQSHHTSASQHQQRQQHLGQQHSDGDKEKDDHFREMNDGAASASAWASYGVGGARDSHSSSNYNNSAGQDGDANAIGRAPSPLSLSYESHSGGSGGIEFDSSIPPSQLPDSPKWSDLDEIIDAIAGGQMQQREDMLIFLSQSDCAYIKSLLGLFHSAPEDQLDRGGLATLAVCIKSILLLNDPEIIEYVTTDEETFESVCGVLEYNPELREKANYRVFIREQAKFRTVVKMEDEDLMSHIHRLFRVNYLKDFILRPTMDESSLSTLVSLAQFTQSDIIKGVMRLMPKESDPSMLTENYYSKILRVLGIEIRAIRNRRWNDAVLPSAAHRPTIDDAPEPFSEAASESSSTSQSHSSTMWHQHVVPQDSSIQSRYIRRKGCLHFLKELFNMARSSLQQQEKDEFISSCVNASVKLTIGSAEAPSPDNSSENAHHPSPTYVVSLLPLLGALLSDPDADMMEKRAALEILSVVTLHDPAVVRRHCLNSSNIRSGGKLSNLRPEPDEMRQIVFLCPPDDLLQSLLFVMSTESDAGLLLQTSEIIRIILETEILGEQVTLELNGFLSDENDLGPSGHGINGQNWNSCHESGPGGLESADQNNFLAMFYDRYLQWLFSPFLYKVFVPKTALPLDASLETIVQVQQTFRQPRSALDAAFRLIPPCAIRSAFTLEILSFCVRAHVYRMKLYVLRTRSLSTTLKILSQKSSSMSASDDRCLKLASLKLLRSVLSVKDEFYHRHIVQFNLFAPVFDLFRSIPVGNNLVSSAILEVRFYQMNFRFH
ncbi:hypothetical protein HJC23_009466 [Cyclotella cryptica]|uniref:Serine/threonine-protein phosphatase 4 regulatory subunit 3-like central domain-containing protein n=1 Tax=Cyclotella cryptica TaxID=29204 RepID=A0ABD3Q184_9STRA